MNLIDGDKLQDLLASRLNSLVELKTNAEREKDSDLVTWFEAKIEAYKEFSSFSNSDDMKP